MAKTETYIFLCIFSHHGVNSGSFLSCADSCGLQAAELIRNVLAGTALSKKFSTILAQLLAQLDKYLDTTLIAVS